MDGFPLIFARDPGMTRRVIQYLEQLRKRDGRTVYGERASGKSTALLIFVHEVMSRGCTAAVLAKTEVNMHNAIIWHCMYHDEPPPFFISQLSGIGGNDCVFVDEPGLFDRNTQDYLQHLPPRVMVGSIGSF
jgi:hypothetical protein